MNYCLYCDRPFLQKVSWASVLTFQREELLCTTCVQKLKGINGSLCGVCGRPLEQISEKFQRDGYCLDCVAWGESEKWSHVLKSNHSLFLYNSFLKDVIAKYKFRGDAELAKLFIPGIQKLYNTYHKKTIVTYIPLSKEREYERGFNQSHLIASHLPNCTALLIRNTNEQKQSKKSKKERLLLENGHFSLDKTIEKLVKDADITIVDDIYTTGSTVRQAAKILRDHGARTVCSITIARG
ncbi:ComF family protein [Bacillus alkalicellulosilyticus]|uniref:ComF family protein n=1 Tax=Alkalihalobacterium alkalicellulosilyticum TaxID=1912214 RepID=UPI000997BB2E|nr:ComF family protein [Bacillus alkalicellulosilyticus]